MIGAPRGRSGALELFAARDRRKTHVFQRDRILFPETPEERSIQFQNDRFTSRDDRRRAGLSGQERHLAEVATRLDRGDFLPARLQQHRNTT